MKVSEARIKTALDRPTPDIRFYLLHGPDEAGAMALAARLGRAMGPEAERVDLDGPTLRADPARLLEEAASLSLFGGARHVRVTGAGEESLAAVDALLEAERAGNPVVMIAPALRSTAKLVKRAIDADGALVCALYVPTGEALDAVATQIAREHGLRVASGVARRLAQATAGDRAIMAREVEKLALYLDAAADRPQTLTDEALDAVGADSGEADSNEIIDAVLGGRGNTLGDALREAREGGASPIPWLRQLARRLAALAEMRADVARGNDVGSVMKRHRVFFKEEATTATALRRWSPDAIAAAQRHVRLAERALVSSGNAGDVIAGEMALSLARR